MLLFPPTVPVALIIMGLQDIWAVPERQRRIFLSRPIQPTMTVFGIVQAQFMIMIYLQQKILVPKTLATTAIGPQALVTGEIMMFHLHQLLLTGKAAANTLARCLRLVSSLSLRFLSPLHFLVAFSAPSPFSHASSGIYAMNQSLSGAGLLLWESATSCFVCSLPSSWTSSALMGLLAPPQLSAHAHRSGAVLVPNTENIGAIFF